MKHLLSCTLLLFLLALGTGRVSAQQQRVVTGGEVVALSADDPRARRATELLEPLLRGDLAAAGDYLKEHAAPGFGQGEMAAPLSAVAEQFAGSEFTVGRIRPAMEDGLLVELRKGDERRGVIIRIERTPPHRILGFVNAQINMQRGRRP